MGCCASVCESTPDVPANIIADPEVRVVERATEIDALRIDVTIVANGD